METEQFNDVLLESAKEVFETMIFMELAKADEPFDPKDDDSLLGTITFTGDMDGCLAIGCTVDCAKNVAANMLGMDPDEQVSSADVNDAMGEVANMVMGSVKSRIQEQYTNIQVSIPSVVSGRKLENSLGEKARRTALAINIEGDFTAELSILYRMHETATQAGLANKEVSVNAADPSTN